MEAKELRINNLVYWNGRLETIDLNSFGTQWNNSDGRLLFEEYKPIPLTEEWLLKFGFFYDKIEGVFLLNGVEIVSEKYNFNYTVFGWCEQVSKLSFKIKHVNELQNLYYALTQKELTIKK
tara:strand:+ start:49 stop:411 length:363 start_codon:yes stop_codon:yes gene_type:complete